MSAGSRTKFSVNYRYTHTSDSLLRDILARDPGASLQDIRHAHTSFRKMSPDHLSLRLGRMIDRLNAGSLK